VCVRASGAQGRRLSLLAYFRDRVLHCSEVFLHGWVTRGCQLSLSFVKLYIESPHKSESQGCVRLLAQKLKKKRPRLPSPILPQSTGEGIAFGSVRSGSATTGGGIGFRLPSFGLEPKPGPGLPASANELLTSNAGSLFDGLNGASSLPGVS
jgi:hypothetical protein